MPYTLTLTSEELNALAWIADRYTSAEVLYDGMELADEDAAPFADDVTAFIVPEHVVWEYVAALPEDNGVPGAVLPPCAGGTLAAKLIELWESVV